MSFGVGAYKVGGAGQCYGMRRRYSWQPSKQPPAGTVTLNNSVEHLSTNTYLALTSRAREGWEKTRAQNGTQTASNCNNTLRRTASKQLHNISLVVPLLEASGHP